MLIIDIETVPREDGIRWTKDPPFTRTFKQYEIPSDLEELKPSYAHFEKTWTPEDCHQNDVFQMSVHPEYCQIIAVGVTRPSLSSPLKTYIVGDELNENALTEKDILVRFWNAFSEVGSVLGYNILGFDMPVILARSAIHEVSARGWNPNAKPWDMPVIDLMKLRYSTNYKSTLGLKPASDAYGFVIPEGYEDVADHDGSNVYELWQQGETETIRKYLQLDLHRTRFLAGKWKGYFWK